MTTTALRAWERRYDVLSPARSAGGQRLYTDADVERVRQVRRLVEAGGTVPAAAPRRGDRSPPPPNAPAPTPTPTRAPAWRSPTMPRANRLRHIHHRAR